MLKTRAGDIIGTRPASRDADTFLPARHVWERYGVTPVTLHRWLADPRLAFPRPTYIGRFRYWKLAVLEQWERERAAKSGEIA